MAPRSASTARAAGTLASCLASCLVSLPAIAATATASFGVSATVQATCLASAPAMAFATGTAAVVRAASNVSVNCSHSAPYTVSLSTGLTPLTTVTAGMMAGSASALSGHALSPGSAHPVDLGRTVGSNPAAGAGNGPSQPLPAQGQTARVQDVAPSVYADTIFVTVTY